MLKKTAKRDKLSYIPRVKLFIVIYSFNGYMAIGHLQGKAY